ncbi:MAG: hypothetical protein WC279_14350 [Sulfurimonas sp.]|jgi:hypothetical protein|uniref:hypothetical protein n=1 Tax=unclassified Sulfurimonas TaxID=2623549 RepID=UPI0008B89EEA|nr:MULTISPECIES: hypothetical protein [unclassified Sulfurimonas]OHE11775.1 MAG: hypothetical protein A3J96_01680 [Sulfurimonas sp. RIFOXYC2_FULL_36_7]OHE21073.1 MAG: hypothetical protein A2525_01395 [Sulfurimonas sp. RIFOXYD12_FULL_36_11]MBS4067036.1 hypothetical protein [Sulfurimonas sp.]MDD3854802.1 hypothetical protein [Sulfurimonas sp.]OHE06420.1 MAG: hypothetical protein A2345_07730 [Sulfurimonas sp. RIFOXYB12_FULL_35_9]
MAKNKKSIELMNSKISFTLERTLYNVIRFFPTKMTVDVMIFEDGVKEGIKTIPFAHLPKEIKKIIKPN